jgi:hypothetical protein
MISYHGREFVVVLYLKKLFFHTRHVSLEDPPAIPLQTEK